MPALAERVDRIEDLMAQLLETTAQTSRELLEFKDETRAAAARADARLEAYIVRSEQEMHEFKTEMRTFIGIVSSLYVDDSIVALGSKLGLFVLGFGDDLLDVLNSRDFTPRYF